MGSELESPTSKDQGIQLEAAGGPLLSVTDVFFWETHLHSYVNMESSKFVMHEYLMILIGLSNLFFFFFPPTSSGMESKGEMSVEKRLTAIACSCLGGAKLLASFMVRRLSAS